MDSGSNPGGDWPPETPEAEARLTREERRELLAKIERHSSRIESPREIIQRAEQALAAGNLDQARRLIEQLESSSPDISELMLLEVKLREAEQREKEVAKVRTTEQMLARYIQQRKKKLAELALETLVEIAPDHPRRSDYEVWISHLDEEVALQNQLDEQLAAGLAAIQIGDMSEAQRRLVALRDLDPDAPATEELAAEMIRAERGQAESADIEQIKQTVEELLASGQMDEAEQEVERLGRRDVPKITLDFLHKRLEDARAQLRVGEKMAALDTEFEKYLEAEGWAAARDVAHRFGQRFKNSPRAAEMFNEVSRREAEQRRQQSIAQGLATLERFLAEGKRSEAELALKLLQGLDLEEAQLAALEERVRKM